jgi:hypothetical protein
MEVPFQTAFQAPPVVNQHQCQQQGATDDLTSNGGMFIFGEDALRQGREHGTLLGSRFMRRCRRPTTCRAPITTTIEERSAGRWP